MPRQSKPSTSVSRPPIRPPAIMGPIMPQQPSFTQNVKDGFSLGLGVSLARSLVDRIFSPSPIVKNPPNNSCQELFEAYKLCSTTENCSHLFDQYSKCLEKTKDSI